MRVYQEVVEVDMANGEAGLERDKIRSKYTDAQHIYIYMYNLLKKSQLKHMYYIYMYI